MNTTRELLITSGNDLVVRLSLLNPSFHAIMYTAEGKVAMDRLWNETLEELDFAHVKDILAQM
jgi:hypothetical protein